MDNSPRTKYIAGLACMDWPLLTTLLRHLCSEWLGKCLITGSLRATPGTEAGLLLQALHIPGETESTWASGATTWHVPWALSEFTGMKVTLGWGACCSSFRKSADRNPTLPQTPHDSGKKRREQKQNLRMRVLPHSTKCTDPVFLN